jgi:hypothetical protein
MESIAMGIKGMTDGGIFPVTKPCQDCTILSIESSLEYADGKIANTDTGSWLHHVVLMNAGPDVTDIMCGGKGAEALMMDGNERTPNTYYKPGGHMKSGYPMTNRDTMVAIWELMNMDPVEKWVWLTLSYEYIDGHPQEYHPIHQLFLSIGPSCSGFINPYGKSNLSFTGQPKSKVFQEFSIPWKSPVDGYLLGMGTVSLHIGQSKVC